MLAHPQLLNRPCGECKAWLYDDGERLSDKKATRRGQPCRRPGGVPTPCSRCPKIPKGAAPRPENAVELSEKNFAAIRHYFQSRAVGASEEERRDAIVRKNWSLIDRLVRIHEIEQGTTAAVAMLFAAKSVK